MKKIKELRAQKIVQLDAQYAGLPEWYKQQLLESQFEELQEAA